MRQRIPDRPARQSAIMDQDFHYYGTYHAARTGGFGRDESTLIAKAANFIDFFTETSYAAYWKLIRGTDKTAVVAQMDNPRYTFQGGLFGSGAAPEDGLWCSYHFTPGNYDDPADTPSRAAVHGTAVADFLPPFQKRDTQGGRAILQRWNPQSVADLEYGHLLNRPQSALSRQLILDAVSCATDDARLEAILGYAKGGAEILQRNRADNIRRFRLILLGVRAHVIADTWAHQDFCGLNNVMNTYWDVEYDPTSWNPLHIFSPGRQSINYQDGTGAGWTNQVLSWAEAKSGLLSKNFEATPNGTSYLGHGWMGHLPDFSFVSFSYKPCWADPQVATERNNPMAYQWAWVELVSLFTQAMGRGHLNLDDDFRPALGNAVRAINSPCHLAGHGTGRSASASAWQGIFGDPPSTLIDVDAEPDPRAVLDGAVELTTVVDRFGTDLVTVDSDLYLFQIAADYHFHFVKHYLQAHGLYRFSGTWSLQVSALAPEVSQLFTGGPTWSDLQRSELAGGGSSGFDDVPANVQSIRPITRIVLHSGDVVDSLAVTYGGIESTHGGTGGLATVLDLEAGDAILEVSGQTGYWMAQTRVLTLTIKTRSGKVCTGGSRHGSSNGTPFSFQASGTQAIVGFFGSVATVNSAITLGTVGVGLATRH